VDEYLKSVPCEEEATRLVNQIVLLKNRGFRFTKWLSNNREVLRKIFLMWHGIWMR